MTDERDPQAASPRSQAPLPVTTVVEDNARPLLRAVAERYGTLAGLLARAGTGGEAGGAGGGGGGGLEDADLVHDLRVGSRRVGEVARLLEPFMDKPAAKAVGASLKDLRRAMGDLRDSDVTREHLTHWRMPAAVRAVAKEMAAELEAKRGELVRAAAGVIGSARVQGTMVVLARVIEEQSGAAADGAERRLEDLVAEGLKKREKQLRKAFGKAAMQQTPEALHAARVAAKKLRYVSELAAEAKLSIPGDVKKQVKTLKKMQELLGDHHDVHVIVETLEKHLDAAREKPVRGLNAAWKRWRKATEREQARRAAEFFMQSYAWINRG
jgi:CHAD domain-containing protein